MTARVMRLAVVLLPIGIKVMKMPRLRPLSGFTLLELMIVVAIIATLLLATSSLTSAWVDGTQVNNASSALQNAVNQARVAALRNANNKEQGLPVASVCIETGKIDVVLVANNTTYVCHSAFSELIRTTKIGAGVSIEQSNVAVSCLTFNSNGLLVPSIGGCVDNISDQFVVEKNNERAEVHVI